MAWQHDTTLTLAGTMDVGKGRGIMDYREDERARLLEYGHRLKAAGFRVWYTDTWHGGWLTYCRDGFYGTFQCSDYGGWRHLMPITPSREYGSSMFIGRPVPDPWTVKAAAQCASPFNRNDVVGWQANAGQAWISPDAVEIETDEGNEQ